MFVLMMQGNKRKREEEEEEKRGTIVSGFESVVGQRCGNGKDFSPLTRSIHSFFLSRYSSFSFSADDAHIVQHIFSFKKQNKT